MRIFVAGLRKLIRRPATWVTLLLLIGLLVLVYLAVGGTAKEAANRPGAQNALLLLTFPGAYLLVLSFILGLGGLLAVIYGAAIAGSEWSWGTLKVAVARGEGRSRYMVLSFVAIAVIAGVGLLVAFAIGVVAALAGATLAGVSTSGLGDGPTLRGLPEQLARGWIAIVEEAALGFAVATIARSQLAGVGVGIALYFGEQFAGLFLPDIVKYLPFQAANAVVAVGENVSSQQIVRSLEPNTALVVVAAWLLGALVVASVMTERAEIGG
ncbi:MAG TPA: ABC transporter permease subunit [Candidatus Limnocylindria bacterium]|nr:ABC transporter permease subunit [Candidatus Limnocylindria bacterium]